MNLFKKYPTFVRHAILVSITTGVGWIYYQIRKTREILHNALDTSVLDIVEPTPEKADRNKHLLNENWLKQQSPSGLISRIIDNLKFSYARRLLSLANSDNKMIRKKAVDQLAGIKLLDAWHCSMLANMMDAPTAVCLARCPNVDKRLFIEPPLRYLTYNRDMMVNAMKEFLVALYEKSQHPCMGYFISRVFVDEQALPLPLITMNTNERNQCGKYIKFFDVGVLNGTHQEGSGEFQFRKPKMICIVVFNYKFTRVNVKV